MGITSITPRLDYSQGNRWYADILRLNDYHKPPLDGIAYQNLVTDHMAWWDTVINDGAGHTVKKSAGKQPAWINYTTNVNRAYGSFAEPGSEMFMTLNRRYEPRVDEDGVWQIKDLTTYIDPAKFNYIFAYTRRDAMNFWNHIKVDSTARRKMSASLIPNL